MLSHSVASDSLWPHWLQPARLLCSWVSPGKNTGVNNHFLLQRIFPTQGLNLGLLHCRWILYPLSYQGEVQIVGKLTNSKEISPHCFCFLDRFSPLFGSVPSHSEKGGTWFPTSPLGQIFPSFLLPRNNPSLWCCKSQQVYNSLSHLNEAASFALYFLLAFLPTVWPHSPEPRLYLVGIHKPVSHGFLKATGHLPTSSGEDSQYHWSSESQLFSLPRVI